MAVRQIWTYLLGLPLWSSTRGEEREGGERMNEWRTCGRGAEGGIGRCTGEMEGVTRHPLVPSWLAPAHIPPWPHMSYGIEVMSHTWFRG